MRRSFLRALTLVFSLLGIADAWYLAEHALTKTALSCGIGPSELSGCNTVAQSAYARFFDIPLGIYGVVFYALVLLVILSLYLRETRHRLRLLVILGVIGMVFSFYFEGLQIFVIKALCIYCLGSFFLSIGIFAASLMLVRQKTGVPPLM